MLQPRLMHRSTGGTGKKILKTPRTRVGGRSGTGAVGGVEPEEVGPETVDDVSAVVVEAEDPGRRRRGAGGAGESAAGGAGRRLGRPEGGVVTGPLREAPGWAGSPGAAGVLLRPPGILGGQQVQAQRSE